MTTIQQAALEEAAILIEADFIRRGLPEYMWPGLKRYLMKGVIPGRFLEALLQNDLRQSIMNADHANLPLLPTYIRFLFNDVSCNCWGSKENVLLWHKQGGYEGGAQ